MITGLSHITFIVRDLERTAGLLEYVFGARRIYESGERTFSLSQEVFFLTSDVWLCIMQGEPLKEQTYNHVAFKIPDEEYDAYLARIVATGVEIRPGRPRLQEEGRSIYFYDFDNHLFELHTGQLEERLARYTPLEHQAGSAIDVISEALGPLPNGAEHVT